MDDLTRSRLELEGDQRGIQREFEENTLQTKALSTEHDRLRAQEASLDEQLAREAAEILDRQKRLENRRKEAAALRQEIDDVQARLVRCKAESRELEARNARIQAKLDDLAHRSREVATLRDNCAEIEREILRTSGLHREGLEALLRESRQRLQVIVESPASGATRAVKTKQCWCGGQNENCIHCYGRGTIEY